MCRIHGSSLICLPSCFFIESNRVGQARLAVAKSTLTVPDLPSCPWERDPKRGTLQNGGEAHQPVVPWVSLLVLKDGLNRW